MLHISSWHVYQVDDWSVLDNYFALAGEQEVFSDEYTECMRNPNWKTSGHPVVHQYREFYDEKDYYGVN